MKKINTKGFSHVEIFIVVVVVGLIGAIGFFVYNTSRDRSSKAENVVAEPVQVDNDIKTFTSLTEAQSVANAPTFTKVIDISSVGQAFACKVNANVFDGIRYYFKGKKSREMWTVLNASSPNGPLGGTESSLRLRRSNTIKLFKPTSRFPTDFNVTYRFSLKNTANQRVDSQWIPHKDLTRCP